MSDLIETSDLLKRAWEAVEESGIPEFLWAAAFPLAYGELRGAKKSKPSTGDIPESAVLSGLAEQDSFFQRIANETDVSTDDLGDVFYVTDGKLHLKVASKDLGDNTKAAAMTVTSLLAGAVFAGTDHRSLPINDVHEVCKAKRCHDEKNASTYVRSTPSIATIGSPRSLEITHKSGWQGEFANAVGRVLGRTDGGS